LGSAEPALVIPIRSFADGKTRLASLLPAKQRAELLCHMASGVVRAADGLTTVIVSSAEEVRAWASSGGLACIDDAGSLDAAAEAGIAWARAQGFRRAIVAHADLPLARNFRTVIDGFAEEDVVLVRGNRDRGTPVLAIPTNVAFRFCYGPGSFDRHLAEARRRNLPAHCVVDAGLATDLDTPEDVCRFRALVSSHEFDAGPLWAYERESRDLQHL
jgi:2-phospho-L-lactate/phosphoenolpyruvate guanylyltransferase